MLGWPQTATKPLPSRLLTPFQQHEGEKWAKSKKCLCHNKDSFISEGKRKRNKQTNKAQKKCKNNHHLPKSGQYPARLWAMANFPKQPFPYFLLLSMALYVVRYPSGWSGSAVSVVSHPSFMPPLVYLLGETEWRKKRKPWCCESTAQQ